MREGTDTDIHTHVHIHNTHTHTHLSLAISPHLLLLTLVLVSPHVYQRCYITSSPSPSLTLPHLPSPSLTFHYPLPSLNLPYPSLSLPHPTSPSTPRRRNTYIHTDRQTYIHSLLFLIISLLTLGHFVILWCFLIFISVHRSPP